MDVLLITGFLGAGKTTLIRHLLRSGFSEKKKVAVIVNEVGKRGIDGEVISKQTGHEVNLMELTSGCICCTLKSDFLDALIEIHKSVNPSHLIVEATGIAQPGDMFDILYGETVSDFINLKNVITVVDTDFFDAREALDSFYDNQIKCADIVILNKTDMASKSELEGIKSTISGLNAKCHIIPAQHCAVDPDILLEPSGIQTAHTTDIPFIYPIEQGGFRSFTFQSLQTLDKEKLDLFLENLPPGIFRCKGWVNLKEGPVHLNLTGGGFSYEPLEETHDTTLVFVGRNFNEESVRADLEKCIT